MAKYMAIVIPFAAFLVYMTQKFYLRTSRQLRFLDIEAKAPLYTHFLELVSGAATVRAFKWQASFDKACVTLLNLSQRPVYLMYCVQQCLGFFLDMLVAVLAVILVAIVVFLRDKFDPGDVGVALVMVMTFNSVLMQLIKDWTNMETSIGAVSRVKVYSATTELEESTADRTLSLPIQWPSAGAIEFSDVVARHS
jgi:ABC-type multidrug transport system fused ATPase/permease subunit